MMLELQCYAEYTDSCCDFLLKSTSNESHLECRFHGNEALLSVLGSDWPFRLPDGHAV